MFNARIRNKHEIQNAHYVVTLHYVGDRRPTDTMLGPQWKVPEFVKGPLNGLTKMGHMIAHIYTLSLGSFLFWCQSRYAAIGRTIIVRILPEEDNTPHGKACARKAAIATGEKRPAAAHSRNDAGEKVPPTCCISASRISRAAN